MGSLFGLHTTLTTQSEAAPLSHCSGLFLNGMSFNNCNGKWTVIHQYLYLEWKTSDDPAPRISVAKQAVIWDRGCRSLCSRVEEGAAAMPVNFKALWVKRGEGHRRILHDVELDPWGCPTHTHRDHVTAVKCVCVRESLILSESLNLDPHFLGTNWLKGFQNSIPIYLFFFAHESLQHTADDNLSTLSTLSQQSELCLLIYNQR